MHERHKQYLRRLVAEADDACERHDLKGVRAEVVFVLDVSKSMYEMYNSGMVAELSSRLLALSLEFDDDGVIPAYGFGDTCRHLGDLKVRDFPNWVEREVIRTGADFQNKCNFAPVINDVCNYFFPEDWRRPTSVVKVGRIFKKKQTLYPTLSAPRAYPVYALFVTSGDCMDQAATTDVVRRSSRLPIFWQFVGLQSGKGQPTRFSFLKRLDKLGNTYVDNCGFFEVKDARDDDHLFEGMCKEFPSYLALPKVRSMLLSEDKGGLTTKGPRGGPLETHTSTSLGRMEPEADHAAGLPTLGFAHEESRHLRAMSRTRSVPGMPSVSTDAGRPAVPDESAPAHMEARGNRIRRATEQRGLAATPERQDAHTVVRPAADEDPAFLAAQEEKTKMFGAAVDEDDDDRGGRPGGPNTRPSKRPRRPQPPPRGR